MGDGGWGVGEEEDGINLAAISLGISVYVTR